MSECKLKGFQQVLVRDEEDQEWVRQFFSYYDETSYYPYSCMGDAFKFCIPFEGNEHLADTSNAYELPYEPQDGDFVAFGDLEGDKRALQIFKSNGDGSHYAYVTLPLCLDTRDYEEKVDIDEDFEYSNINIRPATEEEKQLLLSRLHEAGKDWDAEKKEIVDWKWVPCGGETYYYPRYDSIFICSFRTGVSVWVNDDADCKRKEVNHVFRTADECQTMCDKLNEAIKEVK